MGDKYVAEAYDQMIAVFFRSRIPWSLVSTATMILLRKDALCSGLLLVLTPLLPGMGYTHAIKEISALTHTHCAHAHTHTQEDSLYGQ